MPSGIYKRTKENLKNLSLSHIGKNSGKQNGMWKVVKVSYRNLHRWIERQLGKADHCEHCGLTEIPKGKKRYFQWANKSKKYLRNLNDWIKLCVKCHKHFDGYGIGEYDFGN